MPPIDLFISFQSLQISDAFLKVENLSKECLRPKLLAPSIIFKTWSHWFQFCASCLPAGINFLYKVLFFLCRFSVCWWHISSWLSICILHRLIISGSIIHYHLKSQRSNHQL